MLNLGNNLQSLGLRGYPEPPPPPPPNSRARPEKGRGGAAPRGQQPRRRVRDPKGVFWGGTALFVVGSLLTFASFGLAAQSLLAALEGVQFVTNVAFAKLVLGRPVTLRAAAGVGMIVGGVAAVVAAGSHDAHLYSAAELLALYRTNAAYQAFLACAGAAAVVLRYTERAFSKRLATPGQRPWPRSHAVVPVTYALFSALFGTQSVVQAKGLMMAVSLTWWHGENQFSHWFTYAMLAAWLACVAVWLARMSTALKRFDPAFVIPLLQSSFILLAIVSGGLFFGEFGAFGAAQAGVFVAGVGLVCAGLYFLTPKLQQAHEGPRDASGGSGGEGSNEGGGSNEEEEEEVEVEEGEYGDFDGERGRARGARGAKWDDGGGRVFTPPRGTLPLASPLRHGGGSGSWSVGSGGGGGNGCATPPAAEAPGNASGWGEGSELSPRQQRHRRQPGTPCLLESLEEAGGDSRLYEQMELHSMRAASSTVFSKKTGGGGEEEEEEEGFEEAGETVNEEEAAAAAAAESGLQAALREVACCLADVVGDDLAALKGACTQWAALLTSVTAMAAARAPPRRGGSLDGGGACSVGHYGPLSGSEEAAAASAAAASAAAASASAAVVQGTSREGSNRSPVAVLAAAQYEGVGGEGQGSDGGSRFIGSSGAGEAAAGWSPSSWLRRCATTGEVDWGATAAQLNLVAAGQQAEAEAEAADTRGFSLARGLASPLVRQRKHRKKPVLAKAMAQGTELD